MKKEMRLSDVCKYLDGRAYNLNDIVITKMTYVKKHIEPGCLFFAFKTCYVDSYIGIELAIEKGVAAIVTEKEIPSYPCIVVNDALIAYMKMCELYRINTDVKVVGITGSIGKTSTKEMIVNVLEEKYIVEKSKNNRNIPEFAATNLLNLEEKTEIFVQEMAMQGIELSSRAIKPDIAIVTNIGYSHVEDFGSVENILEEKMKISSGMSYDSVLILNGDDKMLMDYLSNVDRKTWTYGINNANADCRAINIVKEEEGYTFDIVFEGEIVHARINCEGLHNVLNALASFIVGKQFNINNHAIIRGISKWRTEGYRQNQFEIDGVRVIADCYNASPQSMRGAIDMLNGSKCNLKRIAVIADMLELGEYSAELHYELGKYIDKSDIDELILYGKDVVHIKKAINNDSIKIFYSKSEIELVNYIRQIAKEGDTILFKGSHAMSLEKIIDDIFGTKYTNPRNYDVNCWCRIEHLGIDASEYFKQNGFNKVAICGYSHVAESMLSFLKKSDISVEYVIDNRIEYAPQDNYPIKMVTSSCDYPEVDLVIMGRRTDRDKMTDMINAKMNTVVLSFEEVLNGILTIVQEA